MNDGPGLSMEITRQFPTQHKGNQNKIAGELGIGIAVARKWIKLIPEIGKRVGHYFTPIQVYKIYQEYGHPDRLLE